MINAINKHYAARVKKDYRPEYFLIFGTLRSILLITKVCLDWRSTSSSVMPHTTWPWKRIHQFHQPDSRRAGSFAFRGNGSEVYQPSKDTFLRKEMRAKRRDNNPLLLGSMSEYIPERVHLMERCSNTNWNTSCGSGGTTRITIAPFSKGGTLNDRRNNNDVC
jgi:hypothetical protein